MATKPKKGGNEPKPKKGIAGISPKSEAAKALPVKPLLGTDTTKLKKDVVSVPPPRGEKGIDRARKNRLKRAGVKINNCPVTELPLDVGPRANHWSTPTELNGHVMSWLARAILESEISAKELKKVAGLLSEM